MEEKSTGAIYHRTRQQCKTEPLNVDAFRTLPCGLEHPIVESKTQYNDSHIAHESRDTTPAPHLCIRVVFAHPRSPLALLLLCPPKEIRELAGTDSKQRMLKSFNNTALEQFFPFHFR